jgi:hypothetical protein
MTADQELDLVTAIVLSYDLEQSGDDSLPQLLVTVREISLVWFNRLLVLAAALKKPEFEELGLADIPDILRNFEITENFGADVDRFINEMRKADDKILTEARSNAAALMGETNPMTGG